MRRSTLPGVGRSVATLVATLLSAALPCRGEVNPTASFAGRFTDERLTVDLSGSADGYSGTFELSGKRFKATGQAEQGQLVGTFNASGASFPFTASRNGDVLTLSSGGATYTLRRAANAPREVVRYQRYVIQDDPAWIGGDAMSILIPAGWQVQGGMVWHPETFLRVQPKLQISDPNSLAQVTFYPSQTFTWNVRVNTPTYLGNVVAPPPRSQFEGMAKYVLPQFRRDLISAKVVDRQDLPQLANAPGSWLVPGPGVQVIGSAGRVRFEYQLNGQTVEEDLYVRGIEQVNLRDRSVLWLIDQTMSVRGPKGSLERLSPILRCVGSSARIALPWYNKLVQFVQMQNQITMGEILQSGVRARIRANLSNEISEMSRQQFEAQQRANDAASEAAAETMRDQQPWTTTDGNKVELPFQYGIAWQGANGDFISTNDALYNPNGDLNNTTTYTRLEKATGPGGR